MAGEPLVRMAVRSPRAFNSRSTFARVGKGVELEIGVEQFGAQLAVDRRKPLEAIIQRPLGQRPEFDVAAGERMGPGVFDLLLPPEFREQRGIGPGRRVMAARPRRGNRTTCRRRRTRMASGIDRLRISEFLMRLAAIRPVLSCVYASSDCWSAVDGGLVADLDLLRRRMARGQRAALGRAHPCDLARLLGVRRRARLRGHGARPRPALRARQRLGQDDVSQADRCRGRMDRADPRGHEEVSRRARRSTSGRCTGPSGPGRWRCRAIRNRRALR